jgi:hypothetical protein
MSTPYNFIESTGVIVPDVSDLQTQVQGEFQVAYGADIALTADTPQGKLITAETTARSRVAQMMAMLANMLNPNQAGGVFLDAVCAFLGLERESATFTVVPNVDVAGTPNLVISAGVMQAVGESTGLFYVNTRAVQFDNSGNAQVDFQCTTAGPVSCPVGDLSIATQVLGWETIDNTSVGTPGLDQQSDESLRALRNNTLALQGISTVEAQVSGLSAVPGVLSLKYRENVSATTQIIDGVSLTGHSVWACVDGGADIDVAMSLLTNKTDGAGWNGATTVPVVEPNSGQTYNVSFDRPTVIPVLVRVTMRQGSSTANLPTAVPQAVVDYAQGLVSGDPGFTVGTQVSPFDIAGAVSAQIPGAFVSKVEVAVAGLTPVYQTTELPITILQKASVSLGTVTTVIVP